MKTRWLDRRIARSGPYLALCLSEAEFRAATAHLKSPEQPRWVSSGAAATQYCEDIGERHPGSEQEAYGIQSIAQELLAEFARRMR